MGNYSQIVSQEIERMVDTIRLMVAISEETSAACEEVSASSDDKFREIKSNPGLHRQARNMEIALERMENVRKPLKDPQKMNLSFEVAHGAEKKWLSYRKCANHLIKIIASSC